MMKRESISAVIVEIRGRSAVALTCDGAFERVRNDHFEIGQQLLLTSEQPTAQPVRRRARITAYAAMAAGFLLLVFGGFKGYTTPAGVVSLDVNPSIEYTINAFDRVLDISAVNDDGERILANMDENALLYRPVDEAVDATILALRESGYFSGTAGNDVVISAFSYSVRHTEQIAERLGNRVGEQDDLTVLSVPVSKGEVESAHALGTSAGKLHIVEELEASWTAPETFDADEWILRPVREIIGETKTQREGRDEQEEEQEQSSGIIKSSEDQQSTYPEQDQQGGSSEQEQQYGDAPHQGESKQD